MNLCMHIVRMQGLGAIRRPGTYAYTVAGGLIDCLGIYYHAPARIPVYSSAPIVHFRHNFLASAHLL